MIYLGRTPRYIHRVLNFKSITIFVVVGRHDMYIYKMRTTKHTIRHHAILNNFAEYGSVNNRGSVTNDNARKVKLYTYNN